MFQLDILRASFEELNDKLSDMYNWPISRGPLKHGKLNSTLDLLAAQTTAAKEEEALDPDLLRHLDEVITYSRNSECNGWVSWNNKIAKNTGRESLLTLAQSEAVRENEIFCDSIKYIEDHL